jgi:hypothetical protein
MLGAGAYSLPIGRVALISPAALLMLAFGALGLLVFFNRRLTARRPTAEALEDSLRTAAMAADPETHPGEKML